MSEKIRPVSPIIGQSIVNAFLPAHLQAQKAKILASSGPCLARLYLGGPNTMSRGTLKDFKLYDFPLLANDREKLKMPTERIAFNMADALVVMH